MKNKDHIINNFWKKLKFCLVSIGFIVLSNLVLIVFSPTAAQKISEAARICHESVEARYKCYLARYSDILVRTKEKTATRKSVLDSQRALRQGLKPSPKDVREKEREEIKKLAEASRKRNVSHRGKAYTLNYGFILEPRD